MDKTHRVHQSGLRVRLQADLGCNSIKMALNIGGLQEVELSYLGWTGEQSLWPWQTWPLLESRKQSNQSYLNSWGSLAHPKPATTKLWIGHYWPLKSTMRDWQPANVSVFTPGAGRAVVGDCQFSQSPYSSGNLHCMNEQDGSPSLDHSSLLQGPAVQPRQQPHPTWWCLSCSLLVVSSTSERTTWKPSTWALSLGILILVSWAKKGEKLGIAYRHHPRASIIELRKRITPW